MPKIPIQQIIRLRLRVTGTVQGVGFRPFVWQRATRIGLQGWVLNDSAGVMLEIQGTTRQTQAFLSGFRESAPSLARVDSLVTTKIAVISETTFAIRQSAPIESASTPVSPDISICNDCLAEFRDPHDRRYQYPFINCTHCGPRFTIVQDVPYDRSMTTMKSFPMCQLCAQEYSDPSSRRFHAQPNACPRCGPHVWFVAGDSVDNVSPNTPPANSTDELALESFRDAIGQGQIVAVKGIGGFHLACDATNSEAVDRLRERKGRVDKPFAVMVADVSRAESFAVVDEVEREHLQSKEGPIVLLRKRANCELPELLHAAAPDNDFVGVLLPYSPLHYLLVNDSCPLVMTSGNLADEPIARTNVEAMERLSPIADSFLLHDRDIHVVCDDSIVRCLDESTLPLRRSRGYAPMPVRLRQAGPSVLAVGGEFKSAFCVTKNDYAFLSQHIGDMGNLETLEAMQHSVDHFLRLFRVKVDAVAADLHPGYLSGQWAERFASTLSVPLIRVQHHAAHAASLIAEKSLEIDGPLIVCCFDGTGYGTDGAIWGGEFMIADGHTFDRRSHLDAIQLPGGDTSIRKPYRIALAYLGKHGLAWDDRLPSVAACSEKESAVLRQQLLKNLNCVSTRSVGRMFDAVASLIGVRQQVTYEAQAAMEMEALASEKIDSVDPHSYAFTFDFGERSTAVVSTAEVIAGVCGDVIGGVDRREIAAKFHHAVANMVSDVCGDLSKQSGIEVVGLTGGVFQNVLLLGLTKRRLASGGLGVATHSVVPPNDGGLALGQAMIARERLQERGSRST